ncbi:MAG: glycosyltransferase [Actinomycetota bacterium]
MSVLLIISDVAPTDLDGSPLADSLVHQIDAVWTLDPDHHDIAAAVMVDHGTTLRSGALAAIRDAFDEHRDVDVIHGDAIIDGERTLRPTWGPVAAAALAPHLDLVASRTASTSGGLAERIEVLGGTAANRIGHLPVALVERPALLSVSLEAHDVLDRLDAARRTLRTPRSVSFVIPTAGTRSAATGRRLVDAARAAARGGGIDDVDILLVVGEEFDGDPAELEAVDTTVVHRPGPWNFSVAINEGLLAARADVVILLNDDIEMLEPGWARPLVDHLRDPSVAMAGAALLYPDQTVQHLGVIIDDAFPLHPFVGMEVARLPHRATSAHEVVAVTAACAAARRADLLSVGGLNVELPASFNDIDLCFKLQREVGRVVVEPASSLVHHESASRVPTIEPAEWERFVTRWGEIVDPWYHPGYHRPDDPDDRRRNADHLAPTDPFGSWPLRRPLVQPAVHRARLRPPTESG